MATTDDWRVLNVKVKHHTGWRKFLTLTYWRFQLMRLLRGQYPHNIIETFEIEIKG